MTAKGAAMSNTDHHFRGDHNTKYYLIFLHSIAEYQVVLGIVIDSKVIDIGHGNPQSVSKRRLEIHEHSKLLHYP